MSKVAEGQRRNRDAIAKALDRYRIFVVGKRRHLTRVLVEGEYHEVPDTRLERLRAGESPATTNWSPRPTKRGGYHG
jgi:hypothetical protein